MLQQLGRLSFEDWTFRQVPTQQLARIDAPLAAA